MNEIELTKLIAEKLGWTFNWPNENKYSGDEDWCEVVSPDGKEYYEELWSWEIVWEFFSLTWLTDLNTTMKLFYPETNVYLHMLFGPGLYNTWSATVRYSGENYSVFDVETPSLALCLAWLKAKGVNVNAFLE